MSDLQQTRLRERFHDGLPLSSALEPQLKQALKQVLQNPGNLIRPRIALEVGLAFGVPEFASYDLAIALEYFHTASLLFDDLPAMDDAIERRGAACVHLQFGEASAMLAGLALINRAYSLVWQSTMVAPLARRAQVLAYLEQHLGMGGLLNGQSMDLHYAAREGGTAAAHRVAMAKTVSLIRLPLVLPALMGSASAEELHLLNRIAVFWGLSYQIVDDLKDVLQSSQDSGKTTLRDLSLGRPNMALLLGSDGAVRRLQRLVRLGDLALERLMISAPATSFLKRLRETLSSEISQMVLQTSSHRMDGAA